MKPSDLLSQPGAWTQGQETVDRDGNPCSVLDEDAVSFCPVGATWRCFGFASAKALVALMNLQRSVGMKVVDWNDAPNRTQAEVVTMLKECGL